MSLDHARHYLHRVVPWIDGSYVNVHWTVPNKRFDPTKPPSDKNKPTFMNGRAFTSVDDAVSHIAYLQTRADARDIYVCMSSQAEAKVDTYKTARGGTVLNAVRLQTGVSGLRSLFVDVDVKPEQPDKGYGSTQEAIAAFKQFMADTGIPVPTMMVSSGTGGFHAYWVLDKTLSRDEWQPLANALSEATRRNGLKTDTQCTVDSVRILRPPGTLNHKRTPAVPVQLGARMLQPGDYPVDTIRAVLTPYIGATVTPFPGTKAPALTSVNSELSAGIAVQQAPPIDLDTVATSCGFVADALSNGGAGHDQPKWNLATLLSTFTMGHDGADGRVQAHRMAKGHKDYDPASTDALYDRKLQERQARNLGWPSCNAIAHAGCASCATCPLAQMGKSPLSYGRAYTAAVAALPVSVVQQPTGAHAPAVAAALSAGLPQNVSNATLPNGYVYNQLGQVCRLVPNADGTHTMRDVSSYTIHTGWLQEYPFTLHFSTRLGIAKSDKMISILVDVLQTRDFAKALARQGFVVNIKQAAELQEFLLSWVRKLQETKDATVSAAPFGWITDGPNLEGFAYAGRVWTPNGDRPAAQPDAVMAGTYTPKGDLQPWIDAARMMTDQKRPAIDAILAAALGAPLMRFTAEAGVVISTYSQESGVGKSTITKVSQGFWGHPKKGVQGLDDTANSVAGRAATLNAIPLYWDELKDELAIKRFVQLAFRVSQGKDRSRMDSNTNQRDPGTWQTLVLVNSNESLIDSVTRYVNTNEAGLMRVFEFVVDPAKGPSPHSIGHVSRTVAKLEENYGAAGLKYSQFLGANHARVGKEVADLHDKLCAKLAVPNDERLWIAGVTCLLAGAKYGNELGLTNIDVQALMAFLVKSVNRLRTMRKTTVVNMQSGDALSSVIQSFIDSHRARNTLVTNTIPMGQGRVPLGAVSILGDYSRLERIVIRLARDQKFMLISQSAFRDWCNVHKYPPSSVIEAMKKTWGVRESVMRSMGAGTSFAGMREYCIEIDLSGSNTNFEDFMPKDE